MPPGADRGQPQAAPALGSLRHPSLPARRRPPAKILPRLPRSPAAGPPLHTIPVTGSAHLPQECELDPATAAGCRQRFVGLLADHTTAAAELAELDAHTEPSADPTLLDLIPITDYEITTAPAPTQRASTGLGGASWPLGWGLGWPRWPMAGRRSPGSTEVRTVWCNTGALDAIWRRPSARIRSVGGFKKFLLRGNLIELAVAVVIGVAFAAVVAALVRDLITPLIAAAWADLVFRCRRCYLLSGTSAR